MINGLLLSYGCLYTKQQTRDLLDTLLGKTDWQTDFTAYGRRFGLPRLQSWYANDNVHYRYTDNKLTTHPWTTQLLAIKQTVEAKTNARFNSVLLTCYRNGRDQVGWHADDETELGDAPVIASLSLGATRYFHYRHKQSTKTGRVKLHDGQLLVMQPSFQHDWEHAVLPEAHIVKPRINLTFRQVVA